MATAEFHANVCLQLECRELRSTLKTIPAERDLRREEPPFTAAAVRSLLPNMGISSLAMQGERR
jgi:hypothetical protein